MAHTSIETITLSSGAITDEVLANDFHGLLTEVIVNKNGQTNDPVVTIEESSGGQRVILSGVTVTGSNPVSHPVRENINDNTNTATSLYAPYYISSQLQVTVTGGDTSGTLDIQFAYIPLG